MWKVSIQPCKTDLFTFPCFISYARCDWLFIHKRVLWRHEHDFAQSISDGRGREAKGTGNDLGRLRIRLYMGLLTLETLTSKLRYREYFMESADVRCLRTSCWRIRNRKSERSERVRFLIQKQRVRKYRTKHFPCGIVFITYILRHSSFWRPFYFKSFKSAKICR